MSAATIPVRSLREAMTRGVVHAPGCADALSSRIAETYGFDAVYLSGAAVSACELGRRDIGHVGRREMVDAARRVTRATRLPLIADADTGYGDVHQVRHLVEEYEQTGIAALHLEDQVNPKRCGAMAGKELVAGNEAVRRIASAVAARTEIVVIARTDAWSVEGPEAAIERARRYVDAGADMVFVSGATSLADLERVRSGLASDVPLLLNMSEAGGPVRPLPTDDLLQLGVAVVIFPVAGLLAAARAVADVFQAIRSSGSAETVDRWTWPELEAVLGGTDDDKFEAMVLGSNGAQGLSRKDRS